jgi:hypothetical protein
MDKLDLRRGTMKLADMTKEELFAELDERYVRQKDCSDKHELLNEKVVSTNILAEKNNTKLSILIGILVFLAGIMAPLAFKTLWEMAMK